MSFAEILLPVEISLSSSGGPVWETTKTRLDSGREKRNRPWSQELGEWDIGGYLKTMDNVHTLLSFWNARYGEADGFRFWDPFDYTIVDAVPVLTLTPLVYQIVKTYTSGTTYTKNIYKPVPDKMTIKQAGVVLIETTDYTLDDTTGLLTMDADPGASQLTATGEFHKPVRFDIKHLAISYADLRQGTIRVPIVELRLENS